MGANEPEEDWSVADLEVLLSVAKINLDESTRCHQTGSPRAALVMLAGALEAVLLGSVIAYEDEWRAAGHQLKRPASRATLRDLTTLARDAGWLTQPVTDEAIRILNAARNMAAHPGAYVRRMRQVADFDLGDPAGYEVTYHIVVRTCQELFATLGRISPAGPTGSDGQ
ncbi:MAG: hypothetical protein ACRDQ7_02405 [Haloechinothrix sp.]